MHFKGGLYKLIGYAYHSETQEEMVIYQALYGMHKIWVRPKTLFFDKIIRDVLFYNFFGIAAFTSSITGRRSSSFMP